MKKVLQIVSLIIVLGGAGAWLGFGLNPGWTKTSKTVMKIDPVTDIRYPVNKSGFYPGVDFLMMCLLVGLGLFGASRAMGSRSRIRA